MKERTRLDYYQRIARVIAVVLADPAVEHTLEGLAAVACMSPFHFHRVYCAMTGESIAETVRRVRLAKAARSLGQRDLAVTEVAMDAGYNSPQAFSRAFRRFAGVSPSAFQARSWAMTQDDNEEAMSLRVRIIDVAATSILTLRHEGPVETIGQTWRELASILKHEVPHGTVSGSIGMSIGDPEGGDGFTYHAGVIIDADVPIPDRLLPLAIKGGCYASYRLTGSFGLITPTFGALFGGWLSRSGRELDDRPTLEFYRSPWTHRNRTDGVTDVMIPIKQP